MTRRTHRAETGSARHGGATDANALWSRATELARAGQIREAEKALIKLAKLAPNNADIFGFHGTLKVQAGKHAQAVPLLKRALRLDDGNPTTHGSLAVTYEGLSKPDKAEQHYLRALELDPSLTRMHLNFGNLLLLKRDFNGAIGHYEQAVALEPEFSEAYVCLGRAMFTVGRIDEALRCGESALRLDPASAKGHMNLGHALQVSGLAEDAIHHFREAINLDAHLAEAYESYAYARRGSSEESFSDDLSAALARRDWNDRESAYLHYAAGKLESDLGRSESAFAHWLKGAQLRRKGLDYSNTKSRKFFTSICATLDARFLDRRLQQPAEGPIPIFIVGMPRSGTTLAEQILASHPRVAALGELPHLSDIADDVAEWSEAEGKYPEALTTLDGSDWRHAADLYMKRLTRAGGEPYISDKMPSNFYYLGLISLLFPNARIVHCRRNALDNCVSCFTTDFSEGQHWSYELSELGTYYGFYLDLMVHWQRVLPLPIHDIQYESVVADLEGEARRLLDFCGLDWHPECLEFYHSKRPVFTASNVQVRQPVYTSSVGRWRQYEDQLQPLIDNLPPEAIA